MDKAMHNVLNEVIKEEDEFEDEIARLTGQSNKVKSPLGRHGESTEFPSP